MNDRRDASVSDAARAVAVSMRRFDADLSAADVDAIARRIEERWAFGARLNAAGARLANGDEPVTRFFPSEPPRA